MKRLHADEGIMARCQSFWWISRQCAAENRPPLLLAHMWKLHGPFPWDVLLRGMKPESRRIFRSTRKAFAFSLFGVLLALSCLIKIQMHAETGKGVGMPQLFLRSLRQIDETFDLQIKRHEAQMRSSLTSWPLSLKSNTEEQWSHQVCWRRYKPT